MATHPDGTLSVLPEPRRGRVGRPSELPLSDLRPVVTYVEDRGDEHGFVYFTEDNSGLNYQFQEVRVGWIGGLFDPAAEANRELNEVTRYKPYIFCANWGEPTYAHLIAAWDALVEKGNPGFREYADLNPGYLRWMNGHDFLLADIATLEFAAIKERQDAVLARRRELKAAGRADLRRR